MQLTEIKKRIPAIPRRHRPLGEIGGYRLITAPRNKKDPNDEQEYHHWLVDKDGKTLEYSGDYKDIASWRNKYKQMAAKVVKEDWGSSDWYPIMQAMKKAVDGGTSIEDAALDQAHSYYEDMGYETPEDAAERIIQMYKLRDSKGYIKEAILEEGYDERVKATVDHLVKTLDGHNPTKADILSALHDYAAASEHNHAAEHNRMVMWGLRPGSMMANGIPDYNGSTQARNEFIRDVLAGLKGRLKVARVNMQTGAKRTPKPSLEEIYHKAIDIIGDTFPDGDPIDHLGPWLDKHKVDFDRVDLAFKKFEGRGKKKSYGMYDYLADMWKQMAADRIYDAKNGHVDQNSPYYYVEDDGTIKPKQNPWRSGTNESLAEGKKRSENMERAIAALVRDDEDEDALDDDQIRALGKKYKLTAQEIEELVEIGQDAIGY